MLSFLNCLLSMEPGLVLKSFFLGKGLCRNKVTVPPSTHSCTSACKYHLPIPKYFINEWVTDIDPLLELLQSEYGDYGKIVYCEDERRLH